METSPPDDDAAFGLVEQYDSIEDPGLRSDFLDAVGTTRSRINHLRLLRDRAAARSIAADPEPEDVAPEADGGKGTPRPVPPLPLPNRSRTPDVTTRPPNNTGGISRWNRRRRNRERP